MGIPILKALPGLFKAIGKITGIDIIDKAADALLGHNLSPEQELALQQAVMEHELAVRQINIEELKTVMAESQLMIQSDDKYVKRARPTGLYIAYLCSIGLTIALIAGVKVDSAAILTLMAPLYGASGYYMHLRTKEKMNGGSGD